MSLLRKAVRATVRFVILGLAFRRRLRTWRSILGDSKGVSGLACESVHSDRVVFLIVQHGRRHLVFVMFFCNVRKKFWKV